MRTMQAKVSSAVESGGLGELEVCLICVAIFLGIFFIGVLSCGRLGDCNQPTRSQSCQNFWSNALTRFLNWLWEIIIFAAQRIWYLLTHKCECPTAIDIEASQIFTGDHVSGAAPASEDTFGLLDETNPMPLVREPRCFCERNLTPLQKFIKDLLIREINKALESL